jgi:hypothetical protein
MPPAAAIAIADEEFLPELSRFENAFVRTVLEHRGLFHEASAAELSAALDVLQRFEEQRLENPSNAAMWVPALDRENTASLQAKAFMMFGATRPSPAQWHKAHTALFGPLLCATCD